MKHICLILFLCLTIMASYAQDDREDVIKLASGTTIRKGDTLVLGPGKRPDGDYIHIYTKSTVPLDKGFRGRIHVVKDIQTIGSKKRGETQYAIINPTGMLRYVVDVAQAIEAGELVKINSIEVGNVSSGQTVPSVADELIKLKSLLDAGAITQAEYDSQKKKLLGIN